MTARLIDGKALALQVREKLATESAAVLAKTGMKPGLATILVGDDPASHLYVKSKQKACDAAGIYIDDHKLPASTTQAELLALIEKETPTPRSTGYWFSCRSQSISTAKLCSKRCRQTRMQTGFTPTISVGLSRGIPCLKPARRRASLR